MDLQRLNAKFFVDDPQHVSPDAIFRVFNAWISQTPDHVLVDVADYSHVRGGPAPILVGHEANYSIDNTDSRPGLLYARKQPQKGGLRARIRGVLSGALRACRRLEEEPDLGGALRFRGDELVLVANDRLRAPNTDATWDALRPEIEAELSALFGRSDVELTRSPDPQQRLTVHASAGTSQDVSSLLANLGSD